MFIVDSPTLSPPQNDGYGGVQHSVQSCQNECPPGPPGTSLHSISQQSHPSIKVPLDQRAIRVRKDIQDNKENQEHRANPDQLDHRGK